jgi:hypothetical protein
MSKYISTDTLYYRSNMIGYIEGTGRLTNANFQLHCCTDVLDAFAVSQSSRVKLYTPVTSPFWTREWQTKWRQKEWKRMHDVVSIRSKGQALLSLEELGLENAPLGSISRNNLMGLAKM